MTDPAPSFLDAMVKIHSYTNMASNYTASEIKEFRFKLYERVEEIRKEAEKIMMESIINSNNIKQVTYLNKNFISKNPDLSKIILNINIQYNRVKTAAQKYYDTGITSKINKGVMLEISCLQSIKNSLLKFYPENHFYNENNKNIFECLSDDFYDFVYKLYAPEGIFFAGTMIHAQVTTQYISFIKMIINIIVQNYLDEEDCKFSIL